MAGNDGCGWVELVDGWSSNVYKAQATFTTLGMRQQRCSGDVVVVVVGDGGKGQVGSRGMFAGGCGGGGGR